MKFSYNWLKKLINLKESPQKLAEILNIRSFEVETVEKVERDFALDAKIPANRLSDAGHHWGMAKEIAAILQKSSKSELQNPEQLSESKARAHQNLKIKISKTELCPRYTAQILEIKKIGSSPKWMRERLTTCGLRPIDAVVDITNYVMLETGQPLHAFDLDKIPGGKLIIRESGRGEELTTLDGTKHVLPKGAIVIEDANRIVDLAGIMGGENSAVSKNTKKILLQAATFDPVRIYKTSRALNFFSAASKLYAAGLDPNRTLTGLARAMELLEKYGGKRMGPLIDIYPEKVAPAHILFRPAYANSVIGQELAPIFYKTVFERLGLGVEKDGENFVVEIPTIRRDLQIEEDLVEEAARMFGYEKITARLPEVAIHPARRNDEVWWEERIKDFLAGAGFTESWLYEFTGDEELKKFSMDASRTISLENPMNPETKYLIPRILIKYVASAAENSRYFDSVKIFGIGKSFQGPKINEHKDLVIVLAQKNTSGEEEFYRLKGAVDELLEKMGISDHWYDDAPSRKSQNANRKSQTLFHPYRFAEIKIGDEKIGNIGEVHPVIIENIKAKARIVAAEIDFGKLWRAATTESEYRPVGKYPAIIRDLAVVVPADTRVEHVLDIIENTGGKLLADTDLFDYFQDEDMRDAEEKSLAFHLIFQSPDRTLKDEEINKLVEKITKALEQKGWELRK
ncbi:MAG: phenylalanine--tRNA ligase subunit beta [Candidatus Sungbacteria bacterium]|nr:phenylalanine--tRNA ligase subunit beta [Candidatus Sungbacteria bacterium]